MKRAPWGDWSLKERKWKMFESISVWHRPIEIRKNQRDEFWWRIVKREKGEQTLTERWERNGGRWLVGSNAFLRDAEQQPSPSFFFDRTCETLASRAATIHNWVFFLLFFFLLRNNANTAFRSFEVVSVWASHCTTCVVVLSCLVTYPCSFQFFPSDLLLLTR